MHYWEGTIKGEVQPSSRSLTAAITVIQVFRHKFQGLYKATDPLPWLSRCPSSRKNILDVQCCLFLLACVLTYLEDFELLGLYLSDGDQGRPLPFSLEPGIEQSTDHNPSVAKLHGWDKSLAWCESLPVYLVYLCHPTKCGPVTFLASLGGLDTAASFIPRRESQIWFNSGSCNGVMTIP